MLKRLLNTALFLFCTLSLGAEANDSVAIPLPNRIAINRLATQIKSFPQEKIYIQTDKPYYAAGERLWFRAYIVHASLNTPFEISRYIYVELLNSTNEVIIRKKIRPIDEMFFGQIDISAEMPEGWYSLRAYTNYMRNAGEEWFYNRQLYIGNPLDVNQYSTALATDGSGNATKSASEADEAPFHVRFSPEGGHFNAGNMQLVGLYAYSKGKNGIIVNGRIVDQGNAEVCTFKSNSDGNGVFAIMADEGKTYTAICEDAQGHSLKIPLPKVYNNVPTIGVEQNSSLMVVSLKYPNAKQSSDTLYMVGHQRGIPIFQTVFLPGKPNTTISKKGMHSGITQFLLLGSKGELLSDRMVFINGDDKATVNFHTDKILYGKRDKVNAQITLRDSEGKPIKGNFSISVTDDANVTINPDSRTIISDLLLESDFKEPIKNPGSYFRADNKTAISGLDMIMLSHKWDRYNISNILDGQFARGDTFALERGSVISGKVQLFPAKRALPGINVSMYVHNQMHFDATLTDKSGKFYFEGFEYPDSTTIMLQAQKKPGMLLDLVVDKESFPAATINLPILSDFTTDAGFRKFLSNSRKKYYLENGNKTYNLGEVVVTGKKEDRNDEIRKERGSLYFSPSYSFSGDDLEHATTLVEVLQRAPGVTVDNTGTSVLIRNATPLIVVDNIEYSMQDLSTITPSDVELIDILKDPAETAMFGSRASNGVICIYLKRGGKKDDTPVELGAHQAKITPLGYLVPAEFYMPNYSSEENRMSSIPDFRSTIYWRPNVVSNENGDAFVSFYTADSPGTYTVTVEGVAPNGEIIFYRGKINRK